MPAKKFRKRFFIVLIVILFSLSVSLIIYFKKYPSNFVPTLVIPSITPSLEQTVLITRVIDGDTVEIESGEHVRYLGVDAKEFNSKNETDNCLAKMALEANRNLVEGKQAVLEQDLSDRDKYDRLLRYIWVDGGLVNKTLLEEGMVEVLAIPPDVKYKSLFLSAQKQAQENKQGMWQEGTCYVDN